MKGKTLIRKLLLVVLLFGILFSVLAPNVAYAKSKYVVFDPKQEDATTATGRMAELLKNWGIVSGITPTENGFTGTGKPGITLTLISMIFGFLIAFSVSMLQQSSSGRTTIVSVAIMVVSFILGSLLALGISEFIVNMSWKLTSGGDEKIINGYIDWKTVLYILGGVGGAGMSLFSHTQQKQLGIKDWGWVILGFISGVLLVAVFLAIADAFTGNFVKLPSVE